LLLWSNKWILLHFHLIVVLIKSGNVIDSFASPEAIGSWWKKCEKSRYSKWKRRDSWKSGTNTGTLLIGKTDHW
jgi:hypothetical protein